MMKYFVCNTVIIIAILTAYKLNAQQNNDNIIIKGKFHPDISKYNRINDQYINSFKEIKITFNQQYKTIAKNDTLIFEAKNSSNPLIIENSAICNQIVNNYRIKFEVFIYDEDTNYVSVYNDLYAKFNLVFQFNQPTADYRKVIAIKTQPIRIINKCFNSIKYLRFINGKFVDPPINANQKEDTSKYSLIIDGSCDTTFYPIAIDSEPQGAHIYLGADEINAKYTKKTTPDTLLKNQHKDVFIKLEKKGYETFSKSEFNLKPDEINPFWYILKKKKSKEYLIFGGTVIGFGVIWSTLNYFFRDNAPKKIPSPPKFPNPK